MRKYIIFSLAFVALFTLNLSHAASECSQFRKIFILGLESNTLSAESKQRHLRIAVHRGDYCAAKYWLEAGIKLEEAFEDDYKNSNPFTITLNRTFSRLELLPRFFVKTVSDEEMVVLLKKYGVDSFRYKLK